MEVLTPYSHHQLGTSINNEVTPQLCGVESAKACGNALSMKNQPLFSHHDVMSNGDSSPDRIDGSEGDMKCSLDKEEKDSDAGDTSVTSYAGKSSKKDSE